VYFKIQYQDLTDRETVINANKDKILTEEQNITEGNFLIFSDTPRLEERLTSIEDTQDLILLKLEGII